ncbi:MAG: glycoside hydrolase family 5 protein [Candidatus Omnitrophota bacterium]
MLKTNKTDIVNQQGRPVLLKGVNLGGWLMMEAYILHALNFPEQAFKKQFARTLGEAALRDFEKRFRDHFIQEEDFRRIAGMGLNCVRVPFHYRLIESSPYRYNSKGLSYLDRVVEWGKKYNIYIILDLHAAAGAQNYDWHSDSLGKAELWQKKSFQDRTYALWERIADHYKDEPIVAGYDLLNESVIEDDKKLNTFYRQLIRRIRGVDRNHIVFVEGNKWATDLQCLDRLADDNLVLSAHSYEPLDFTFNFVPQLVYPRDSREHSYNKRSRREWLERYREIADRWEVPVFVGEFGVNGRQGLYGEDVWLKDTLDCFKELGFHWAYWTYKAMKSAIFPDGIYSYLFNPPWVNRPGPRQGWDTYAALWPKHKKEMVDSWRTENFSENTKVLQALKEAAA